MSLFIPPPGYNRIKIVHSFEELVGTRFGAGINALCWQRDLQGDYEEVVRLLSQGEGMSTLDEAGLGSLPLSEAGRVAVGTLIHDQQLLRDHGLSPILDCIQGYPVDDEPELIARDVYSFHADSATVETDTYLCSYNETSSEGLRNDEARRHVDIPATRAQLLRQYGGEEDEGFREFLNENCFDLHYAPLPHAQPFSFGIGNLWRIAVEYPGSPVPPCIHRAPVIAPGRLPRLLLIS